MALHGNAGLGIQQEELPKFLEQPARASGYFRSSRPERQPDEPQREPVGVSHYDRFAVRKSLLGLCGGIQLGLLVQVLPEFAAFPVNLLFSPLQVLLIALNKSRNHG